MEQEERESMRAGGRATEAGMTFQAGTGMWFAAHVVAKMTLGERFGLGKDVVPVELQFETGEHVDDIRVRLNTTGAIYVQCKTRPNLSVAPGSPLADALDQIAGLVASASTGSKSLDLSASAIVLAVAHDAAGSLNDLETACRFFDVGGTWKDQSQLNQQQQHALAVLKEAIETAWPKHTTEPLSDSHLIEICRLLHIVRFDVDRGGADWREAARVIGSRVYGDETIGGRALDALQSIIRILIQNGGVADRAGLLATLRAQKISDVRSPGFDADIARLVAHTKTELGRLQAHTRIRTPSEISISRDCMAAFAAAVSSSTLVIGEPGSGKTGVLVEFCNQRIASGLPLVFLSVDRLAGIATTTDLQNELGLEHPVLDVLSAWPGAAPAILAVDALDASRGGHAEGVFANLLEQGMERLAPHWAVVASIRTFDLIGGRRFRAIMRGQPAGSGPYVDPRLGDVRHFLIPRLSDSEMQRLGKQSDILNTLLIAAPQAVQDLLTNIFNLSLAADLLTQGVGAESFATIATQSDLIDLYEDKRLPTTLLQSAIAQTIRTMVLRRRLAVLKVQVGSDALDDALNTGVLTSVGDRVAFTHHILFDHAAGRFYLEWDDVDRLKPQVSAQDGMGLLLGPALRFSLERVWRSDETGHADAWRFVTSIAANKDTDPVIASIAFRAVAEQVRVPADVNVFCRSLATTAEREAFGIALSRMSRFVGIAFAQSPPNDARATAWAMVARVAAECREPKYVDGVRILLLTLLERADFSDVGI